MNKRNALLDLSRVISCALSSLEFIRKTVRYTDTTFDEQVVRLFLALPSSQQNERSFITLGEVQQLLFLYIFIFPLLGNGSCPPQ